jgi:hypothetical protein
LVYNQIGEAGAAALAEACKTNTSLTTLSLADNRTISPQSAKQMLEMLILPTPERIQQMLDHKIDQDICLTLAQKTPDAHEKNALHNIHTLLTRNTTLDLSSIFLDTWDTEKFHYPTLDKDILRKKNIANQTKAYIYYSRLAPDAGHVKLSDMTHVLACWKHPELQKYLTQPLVAAKVQGSILSSWQLSKFLFKQGPYPQVLNDDVYSVVCEYMNFWDIAKLCIAKFLPNQEAEDLSLAGVYCEAAEQKLPYQTAGETQGTCA